MIMEAQKSREQQVLEKTAAILTAQAERQAEIESKKSDRTAGANPDEDAGAFFTQFRVHRDAVVANLEEAKKKVGEPRPVIAAAFEALSLETRLLQQYLSDSVRFLPAYDVQQGQKTIDELDACIRAAETELMPKKKFAFKSKKKKAEKAAAAAQATPAAAEPAKAAATVIAPSYSFEIVDLEDTAKRLTADDVNGKDVQIRGLKNCTVELAGQPNVLHIKDLLNCRVMIGPVSRSLLLHNCVGCTFSIACQQLRVHDTYKTDFYLHVTSKAIIEDCNGLRFAPYNYTYDNLEADYKISELDRETNAWDAVDDFKWLNPMAPSPNWCTIPEAERVAA